MKFTTILLKTVLWSGSDRGFIRNTNTKRTIHVQQRNQIQARQSESLHKHAMMSGSDKAREDVICVKARETGRDQESQRNCLGRIVKGVRFGRGRTG